MCVCVHARVCQGVCACVCAGMRASVHGGGRVCVMMRFLCSKSNYILR